MLRLLPLLCFACALDDADLDGDGFASFEGDCDDLDPTVGPGFEELLDDGLDQDCDGADAVLVAAGDSHRCTLDDEGRIHCQGSNERGQLEVPGDGGWTQIAAGAFHTCALTRDGGVRCWGDDRFGQSSVPEMGRATWVGALESASLAQVDRTILCWGNCPVIR